MLRSHEQQLIFKGLNIIIAYESAKVIWYQQH